MLKKLLKYDFLPVYKYWWIAALSITLLSLVSGGGLSLLVSDKNYPELINIISTLGVFLVLLGYGAFSILSAILVFGRFYKNFFTDEGYLTFTLPVKHSQLLNSKLILSVVTSIATAFVIFLNFVIFIFIGFSINPLSESFVKFFSEICRAIAEQPVAYMIIYLLELVVFYFLSTILSCLLLFFCITFACMLVKKGRILAAIGIYYACNGIYTLIMRIFFFVGTDSLSLHYARLSTDERYAFFALMGLVLLLVMALLCGLLYWVEYWMLNRKLNLE